MRLAPRQRVTRKILLAVVAPVALVGVGTLLVAQAQVRAFVEKSRNSTAVQVALITLDPVVDAIGEAGREDALAAAAAHGFFVRHDRRALLQPTAPERLRGGQVQATVALEEGHAVVRYTAALASEVVATSIWIPRRCALAILFAGSWSDVAADLVLPTQQVATLGATRSCAGRERSARALRGRG